MTRTPYDQASKALLERALSRAGTAHIQHEVSPDPQWVDVWFEPDPDRPPLPGLLGRMTASAALFEPFHEPPPVEALRACLRKQFALGHQRGALPLLWVVSAGRPSLALEAFGLVPAHGWPTGVYAAPTGLATFVVVVSELPATRETLLLRLMGAGKTLATAVREVRDIPDNGWELDAAGAALCVLRSRVEGPADEEIAMQVEETYENWLQRVRAEGVALGETRGEARGRAEVVLRILTRRFGALPAGVVARVRAVGIAELDRLVDRALSESSLEDVLG